MQSETKRKRVSGTIITLPTDASKIKVDADIANVEAEQAVIGAVLRDPQVYASVSEILQPGDFFLLWHGYLWHAFDRISGRGEPLDPITVADELQALNQYTDDTPYRLAQIAGSAPSADAAEAYARIVRDSATRLRGIQAADEIKKAFANRSKFREIETAIDEANRLLFEATDQQLKRADTSMRGIVGAYFDEVEKARNSGAMRGIPYGYGNLDELLKSSVPGEITVIAGGEGMGKTTFCLGGIRALAKQMKTVAIFTLEMVQAEIVASFIGMETGIAKRALKVYDLTDQQWGEFVHASSIVGGWDVHVIDEFPALTPLQARRRLRTMMQAEGIPVDLVVIDGLWLMEYVDENGKVEPDRPRAVGLILRDLIQIGRDFNVPIWITHQYNGDAWGRQDKRPIMKDLAESSGVRRNSQVILGLYRDTYYNISDGSNMTEVHVLKDRNGSGAQGQYVEFGFDAARNLFLPITREYDR